MHWIEPTDECFLDTNALVKLYHLEEGSARLSDFLEAAGEDLFLTIADIAVIEFHSAVLKHVRTREIDIETAREAFSCLESDMAMYHVVSVDQAVKGVALRLLDDLGATAPLRTLDSLHLAAALEANGLAPIDYFVTSDSGFKRSASRFFRVFDPQKVDG